MEAPWLKPLAWTEPDLSEPQSRRARTTAREPIAEACRSILSHLGAEDILVQLCTRARALTGARAAFGNQVAPSDPFRAAFAVSIGDGGRRPVSRAALSAHFAAHRRLAVERSIVRFASADPRCQALLAGLSSEGEEPSAAGCGVPVFGRGGRMVASVVLVDSEPMAFDVADLEGLSLLARAAATAFENAHRYAFAKRDQERLFLFQEAAGEALWDWDLERDEIWWGGGITDALGSGELAVSTSPAWKLQRIAQEDARRVRRSFEDALRSKRSSWREEYRFVRADGSCVLVEDRAYFVRDGAGRAFRVVGALRDIAAQKRLEEARVAAAGAESARQELEAFNYSVSHDLRAPLRPLEGFSQALLEDYGDKLDGKAHDYLCRIRGAALRMGQLIDDLFRLSRTGLAEMHVGPVDLGALAEEVIAELRAEDVTRDVTFVSSTELVVRGDAGLLRIALQNLLSNAWKFTRKTREARIQIGVHPNGTQTAFFVRDNGAGFHPAGASGLFQPFRRLHPASEFAGTGIGLAIVGRVVRRHGGRIWAEAAVGAGATFYFTLGR